MAVRGFNLIASSEFFDLCVCTKILSKLCSCIREIKEFVQENVKNCTLISHFGSASGDFVPQTDPQALYRGFTLNHTGKEVPRPSGLAPFTQFLIHSCEPPPHCEILGMPMVKPITITIPSRLWAVAPPDMYWGNVRSPHIGYYSSCYLYKTLS